MAEKVIRQDIANVIMEHTGCNNFASVKATNAIVEMLSSELANGKIIELRGFGTFFIKESKRTKGYNMYGNEVVIIPPMKRPKFKPTKKLLKLCNK